MRFHRDCPLRQDQLLKDEGSQDDLIGTATQAAQLID